jgi:hypothetical protein
MLPASSKSSSRQLRRSTRRGKSLEHCRVPALTVLLHCELVVSLKCYLLSLLRIHPADCPRCNAREIYGEEMRKRLEELNWRTPNPHNSRDQAVDSKPGEIVRSPISLKSKQRKKQAKKRIA